VCQQREGEIIQMYEPQGSGVVRRPRVGWGGGGVGGIKALCVKGGGDGVVCVVAL